jgi:mannose-6-phosphate isomerase-like protein (cupin superfamily)
MSDRINLAEKFAKVSALWQPKIIGAVNDFHVKIVRVQGEFVWHQHDVEDELFLIVKGRLLMKFRDREVWVNEGECIIVPHGVEHCPVAPDEVHLLLLEPSTTLNTGTVHNERTVEAQWI